MLRSTLKAPVDTDISTRASERVLTENQDLSVCNYTMKSRYITAKEIASECDISKSKAYEIIRKLNAELDKMGKITLSGKVPRAFYEFKTYGGTE